MLGMVYVSEDFVVRKFMITHLYFSWLLQPPLEKLVGCMIMAISPCSVICGGRNMFTLCDQSSAYFPALIEER